MFLECTSPWCATNRVCSLPSIKWTVVKVGSVAAARAHQQPHAVSTPYIAVTGHVFLVCNLFLSRWLSKQARTNAKFKHPTYQVMNVSHQLNRSVKPQQARPEAVRPCVPHSQPRRAAPSASVPAPIRSCVNSASLRNFPEHVMGSSHSNKMNVRPAATG